MTLPAITNGPHHFEIGLYILSASPVGLWTHPETRQIGARVYSGGGIAAFPEIEERAGGYVQQTQITMPDGNPAVQAALQAVSGGLTSAELVLFRFNPSTMALVQETVILRGTVDGANETLSASTGTVTMTIAADSRAGTRVLPLRKSAESQSLRGGDDWFQYAGNSQPRDLYWGNKP